MNLLRVVAAVFWKDVQAELRAREALVSMAVFGLLTVVVFNFAFESARDETLRVAPGVLWIAFTFAGVLGLNRSFALEREGGALTMLLLAPVDRGGIYLGKMLANALFIIALQLVVVPVFAVLYNLSLGGQILRLALVLALGAVAIASSGTIFAAVAANARMRDVMTPLLLFPALTPVLIAAVEGTGIVLRDEVAGYAMATRLLAGFAIIFTTVSYMLFEFVLEE